MKYGLLALPTVAIILSGCNAISALQENREAIEMSTEAVCRNVQAVEQSNRVIAENKRKLEEINQTLEGLESH